MRNSFSSGEKNDGAESKKHPVDKSNWISFATFSWMTPFMFHSYRNGLSPSNIPRISHLESCGPNSDSLDQLWTRERAFSDTPSLGKVLWLYCRRRVFFTTIVYLTSIVLGFIGPTILMKRVLGFASNTEAERQDGILWIILLILCEFTRVFFFTLTWAMSYRTALRVKSACMGLAYRKIFRLSSLSDSEASKFQNVISSDCDRVYDVIISGQVAIGGPVVLVLSVGYILYELGWMSLIGMSVFPLAYPLQYLLAKGSGSYKKKAIDQKDIRISIISQTVQNFKFIKMFGWEKHLHRLVSFARAMELTYLSRSQLLQSWSLVLGPTLPHIGAIITFIIYVNSGNSLTPAQCFTILFVFSLLGYSVRAVNQLAELFYATRITHKRIESVLTLTDIGEQTIENYGSNKTNLSEAIVMDEVTLIRRVPAENQDKKKKKRKSTKEDELINSAEKLLEKSDSQLVAFQLENLNLVIKKNSFVGVVAQIGSGKSTFINGITGSLVPEKGKINVMGKLAYVSQEPWIFKGTLRDNVVFGEPFQSVKYYNTIDSCCLVNDFGILPLGDLTETNEKGSNLSGGQKQRLSLARAIYSQSRDIYVLDDPFSGLDSRVAKTIFERVIKGMLLKEKKTVILVTHQLQFLKECDEILVFAEGTIAERGSHDQLVSVKNSYYSNLINSSNHTSDEYHQDIMLEDSTILDCKPDEVINTTKKERPDTPEAIEFSAYNLYIKSAGGIYAVVTILLAFALSIGSTAFSSWWLKQWFHSPAFPPLTRIHSTMDNNNTDFSLENTSDSNDYTTGNNSLEFAEVISMNSPDFELNRNVYAGIIAIIFLTSLFRTILYVFTTVGASRRIHKTLTTQFFSCCMKASDRMGFGQILNLFSRDIGEIDSSLPSTMETFLQNIFIVATVFILVSIVFPVFLGPLFVLAIIFVWVRNVYKCAVRDLKRIEANCKTPIFSRVTETIAGLSTIRAYGKERMLIEGYEALIDSYHSVVYTFVSSIRWLSIRLDCMAVTVTGLTALLILAFHGKVSAAAAGLALAYAAQLSGVFQFTVRLASETEAKFVSVERIYNFLTTTPTENLNIDESDQGLTLQTEDDDAPILNWPYAGHVKFDSVVLTYSSDSLPALRDISFEVFAGQKIGIVGRTGSGKSSLGNAIFRLNELKSGCIYIDEVDIKSLSLTELRQALCVIPQDPSIFQQSIRFNLDAGNEYKDDELWKVLEKVGLSGIIDNLDAEVGLSQGQKQLLSIGRALLRDSKVVFVDEACSNIDAETSAVIDRVLIEEFKSSTVFIIAHRLSALTYCDYILVMEDGEVRDFGPVGVVTKKPEFLLNFERFETITL